MVTTPPESFVNPLIGPEPLKLSIPVLVEW
jgi:hypothetical protein